MDFPGGLEVEKKNPPANVGNTGSILGSGRCPGEGNGDPLPYSFFFSFFSTPVFLPGKFHGQRHLVGYSSWGHKRVENDSVTKQQQQ